MKRALSAKRAEEAPEMVSLYRGHEIGPKADVLALECPLYKMCTLRDAFPEGTTLQILNGKYEWNQPWEVSDFFREIVARCLQPAPDNRPSVADALREFEAKFNLAARRPALKCRFLRTIGCPTSSVAPVNLTIKINFNILRSFSSSDMVIVQRKSGYTERLGIWSPERGQRNKGCPTK
jgi:serine/threonine protein kinase